MRKRLIESGALKSLKGKRIRFNLRPFSNPTHLSSGRVEAVEEMSFVDLHLQVAQEVDALIASLEQKTQQPQEWETAPREEVGLAPEKILSDLENSI